MTNEEFKNIFNVYLKDQGFKRKGNFWKFQTPEIEKVVHLQKSNFSNLYYVNFGYNLQNLNFNGVLMHVSTRLNQSEGFDLENNICFVNRQKIIETEIQENLIPILNSINSETDLINHIKSLKNTNHIFLKVKEHLNL
ncbi:DUF4304 domain-containing protein [Flavobacterium daejeonense]|uniref:DUF4304 domain-containing protein n=1 Tax=Flavobacterium daejeonense TaxID=350893 RepID=UPI000689F31C|nr:DUF4304 domain-containing protein [Flavobacterium daejeonense]